MMSAWHSKNLEQRCQRPVHNNIIMFPGCYYTKCVLIRTDGRLYTCSSDQTEACAFKNNSIIIITVLSVSKKRQFLREKLKLLNYFEQ